MLLVVLRPDEELRELESLSLAINTMFCIREKVLLLDINQQNDKPTQKSQMNTVLKQLGIKCSFSNPYRPQDNSCTENIHNFPKRMLSFYLAQMQSGIRSYHLPATAST